MKEINRDFENCLCFCDKCNNDMLIDSTDYREINKELESYGWVTKYINGYYWEFCSEECYQDWLKENK